MSVTSPSVVLYTVRRKCSSSLVCVVRKQRLAPYAVLVAAAPVGAESTIPSYFVRDRGLPASLSNTDDEIRRVQRRYGSSVTPEIPSDRLRKRGLGDDHLAKVQIQVGTPQPQLIDMLVDTGSPDVVIPLTQCKGCVGSLFDASKSKTFKRMKTPVSLRYLDGLQIQGNGAYDTISYNGLTSAKQGFVAVTAVKEGYLDGQGYSGILGMGLTKESTIGEPTFLDQLYSKGQISKRIFSLFTATSDGADSSKSTVCIGCIDATKIEGGSTDAIQYHDLEVDAVSWQLPTSGIYVGGVPVADAFTTIVDSGSAFIHLPRSMASAFYKKIPRALLVDEHRYAFPCNAKLPSMSINFPTTKRSKAYKIDPKHFNMGPLGKMDGMVYCLGAVFTGDDLPTVILGGAFLKSWVAVFDVGRLRIGFAPAAGV